jgi:hypothetical protein
MPKRGDKPEWQHTQDQCRIGRATAPDHIGLDDRQGHKAPKGRRRQPDISEVASRLKGALKNRR